ncbi:hypothetical protein BDA96_05G224200 [Sorghum bicolor]|uniref:Uncharacterized protein n=2 Tax=Sorghum bicolor TaxID=4558 RepID=A0A1B6PTT5_SORBI|nr:hypothetical protein BDA96_05G224200 [Sorghum bicolor]KXG28833.1 hypothetical protein SORBI_3005G208200 [Sorghum bicolor]
MPSRCGGGRRGQVVRSARGGTPVPLPPPPPPSRPLPPTCLPPGTASFLRFMPSLLTETLALVPYTGDHACECLLPRQQQPQRFSSTLESAIEDCLALRHTAIVLLLRSLLIFRLALRHTAIVLFLSSLLIFTLILLYRNFAMCSIAVGVGAGCLLPVQVHL